MAMYYCHQCGNYIDDDWCPCTEGPDGELWCPRCYEEYEEDMNDGQPSEAQEWFDYDPDC